MRINRRNKFRAVATMLNGERYDSKAEAQYAQHLNLLKKAGAILDWKRGQRMTLIDGPTAMERVTYRADFFVTKPDGTQYAVDVKGVVLRDFRIRALLWRQRFPKMPLVVVDGRGRVVDIFARKTRDRRAA